MENKGIHSKCIEAWNKLDIGEEVSCKEFMQDVDNNSQPNFEYAILRSTASSFLSTRVTFRVATVDKSGGVGQYRYTKVEKFTPSPTPKQPQKPLLEEADAVTLGGSIISLIKSLQDSITHLKRENKQKLEDNTHLHRLLISAKEKIIELNGQVASGKKTINLADIQAHLYDKTNPKP
uniref:Uncharacterized protein n=1 Tax=viral metagenome TaxID=1070528 RepID=A0A6M3IM38_9ZZZZ